MCIGTVLTLFVVPVIYLLVAAERVPGDASLVPMGASSNDAEAA
jgi:hypothetical protein